MKNELNERTVIDNEQLRLLGLFFKISAGITAFFASIPIIHASLGLFLILFGPELNADSEVPIRFIGFLLFGVGTSIVLIGWTIAILKFFAGRFILQRKHRVFCMTMAVIACFNIPYGLLLGVLSLCVFSRTSVKSQFDCSPVITSESIKST